MTSTIQTLENFLDRYKDEIFDASDRIWEYAEIRFEEYKSSTLLKNILKKHGFSIETSEKLPTAFRAQFGSGKPVIALLGEYDALENCGHGCGHNLLGCGALLASLAVKDYLETTNCPGTIVYLGCPAEENDAGKSLMIKEHFFDGIDKALSWHPHAKTSIFNHALANYRVSYRFSGTSAHAAQTPHLGRSALDACELMNIGVNYMREHMPSDCRVHYAYLNSGGTAPNVIPAEAEVFYAIRAPFTKDAKTLKERVDNIARGAALMTETTVDIREVCIYDHIDSDPELEQLILKYLKQFTPHTYAKEELADADIDMEPDFSLDKNSNVSTDVGNVSQIIPYSGFMMTCFTKGTPLHHPNATKQGTSPLAKKGMVNAAKILSCCAVELLKKIGVIAIIASLPI